jgi:ABC-2 type transport system permease protein
MNTQSNAISGSPVESQVIALPGVSATRRMYWSVRRELWENRSIYLAPLAVAAVIVFGFFLSSTAGIWEKALRLDPAQPLDKLAEPYNFAAFLIMAATFIVAVFYCLDALHGERRDRSILFWKSLPVSDLATVLSKASIPLVVLPLLTFAITVVTQFIMLLLSTAILWASGQSIATLRELPLFQMSMMLLYHLVTVHALWYAPIYGWLLLVSAWARRAAFLWAALPLLTVGIVEKIAFNSTHFAAMLEHRLGGGPEAMTMPGGGPMDPMTHLTPGHFLGSAGLWIGLAIAAAFIAGAVRLRRSQGPI